MSDRRNPVLLGKIVATHGIRGQLRVHSYSGEHGALVALTSVLLHDPAGGWESFDVVSAKAHGNKVLLSLKGCDNINQVLHLVGRELYAEREKLPELEEDEFYWCDLIGLSVVTEAGEELGRLTDIIPTGSNDVYVVSSGSREYLVPALTDVVVAVDLAAGIMTVAPPEGLFDL